MTNYKMKFVKSAAALALGTSVITSAVVAGDLSASAKTTYKVSNGKLVNAKTKKAIKGYKVYKSVLYKDGKKFTGTYKAKYYKAGKLFTGVVNKTYYKKGVKATAVYKGVYYKKGKAFTGITSYGNYYENGVKFTGKKGNVYYKNGKKFTGTTSYGNYYVNGLRANGIYEFNGVNVEYKNGKVVEDKTAPVITLEDGAKTSYTVKNGEEFTAPKATAKDNLDKKVEVKSSITDAEGKAVEKIDTTVAGIYTITYTAQDLAANKATAVQVSVEVEDAAPAVKSVKALSATKLQVTFTQAVDATEAVKVGNVTVQGVTLTAPVLSVDGKTLTFTTSASMDVTNATVVVNPIPTKADAKVLTPKYTSLLSFKDTVAPEIKGTEQLSATKVKVTFSEPLKSLGNVTFKDAEGKTADVKYDQFNAGDDSITLDLSKLADDQKITATVVGAQDMAGNLLTPNPSTFTATKQKLDGVLPTVSSIEQTGVKTFKVTFSKAVAKGAVLVNDTKANVTPATEGATTDTVYTVTTEANLSGLSNVALSGFADNDGQTLKAITKIVNFTEDAVAPKVTDSKIVTLDNIEYLQLTFDKAVAVNKDNAEFTVTGKYVKDYVTTTLAATDVDAIQPTKDGQVTDNKVVLVKVSDFAVKETKGAAYDVTLTPIKNAVSSESGIAMTDAVNASFTPAGDVEETPVNESVFAAKDIKVAQGTTPSYVNVTFSGNEVDGASAANKANYSIDGTTVESVVVNPYNNTSKNQVVTLKLVDGSNTFTGVRNITVSNVIVKGSTKVMSAVSFNSVSLKENIAAALTSAKLVENNKIVLTFDEKVQKPTNIKLTSGTTSIATKSVTATENTVTIELTKALDANLLSNLVVNGTVQDSNLNTTTLTDVTVK
ncbi:hypothetical protein CW357_03125 [Rummeliibacillus sp. TYF005]|uniref:immunoglobulin-like domain-containing protein n=1 Tax=Rummeliibacillus sp. TYF005 TaxID=2058214 RepID=UPI000F53DCA0|nr:immunoglobulin-like domain-containing protein [Rummeliibacillus sp. TYF005]RPJ96788.1 hypothetical protein CW357_03125 [Rummeliibacillus sp. TYF005]